MPLSPRRLAAVEPNVLTRTRTCRGDARDLRRRPTITTSDRAANAGRKLDGSPSAPTPPRLLSLPAILGGSEDEHSCEVLHVQRVERMMIGFSYCKGKF